MAVRENQGEPALQRDLRLKGRQRMTASTTLRRLLHLEDEARLPSLCRPAFVLLQAASIIITWPLWQARDHPPMLPLIEGVPQIHVGVILLASLVLVLFRPAIGALVHLAILLLAIVLDQTRLQPEFWSLAILLVGTTQLPYAKSITRAHLAFLWLWAGLNKALSLGFMSQAAPFLLNALPVAIPGVGPRAFGWLIIATEISIGVLVLIPRARVVGIVLAVGLHTLGLLSLIWIGWNPSVWPWNVALALGAIAFFLPSPKEPARRASLALPIYAAFALLPIAFYGGYLDAYLASNLYTSNTASASVMCPSDDPCDIIPFLATWGELNVPLPPEPRLFRGFFEQVCSAGDELVIFPRQTRVSFGRDTEVATHDCPG